MARGDLEGQMDLNSRIHHPNFHDHSTHGHLHHLNCRMHLDYCCGVEA